MPNATTADDLRDEWLVVRCRRRDADAWSELVDRYHGRLTYFVRRLVELDAVESVLQDTWLAVLRGLPTLRSGQRFAPWVYAIARNQAMRRLRSKYRDAVIAVEQPDEAAVDASIEQFDDAEAVHAALGKLPVVDSEILTLFFLNDLSLDEISVVLGVPVGTVKSRLHRAKNKLAKILGAELSA